MDERVAVEVYVSAPIETVWEVFTNPVHIVKWNAASDDWHTPYAENDLCVGGKFVYRMESRNGDMGFDFNGVYDEVIPMERIAYTIEGGRKVEVTFEEQEGQTLVREVFDPEEENSHEMQQRGWQAILDNFKNYTEEVTLDPLP